MRTVSAAVSAIRTLSAAVTRQEEAVPPTAPRKAVSAGRWTRGVDTTSCSRGRGPSVSGLPSVRTSDTTSWYLPHRTQAASRTVPAGQAHRRHHAQNLPGLTNSALMV